MDCNRCFYKKARIKKTGFKNQFIFMPDIAPARSFGTFLFQKAFFTSRTNGYEVRANRWRRCLPSSAPDGPGTKRGRSQAGGYTPPCSDPSPGCGKSTDRRAGSWRIVHPSPEHKKSIGRDQHEVGSQYWHSRSERVNYSSFLTFSNKDPPQAG